MSNLSRSEVQTLSTEASDKEAIGIAILVTVLIVSPIIIILVRNVVATIQVLMDSMIDDDNRRFSFYAFYAALLDESRGKGERVEAGTKEE